MKQRDITAAIYLRLSKDDGGDAESNSIGNQRDILHRYATDHGFIVYKEYVDDGWSGTNFNRPNFKKMIEDIESGGIGVLLIKDLSRLGRHNAMVAFYTEIFLPDNDVRLIALGDNIDTGHGENEIMAFKSVINEYYARDISKKVRAVKRNQALKGEYNGGSAPYGYVKSPDNKHKLIVDEEAATVVRRMFELADSGQGTHQIARIISDDKIIIPTMYKFIKLGFKANRFDENFPHDWHTSTVRRILESRVYVGDIVSQKQGSKSFKNQKIVKRPESEWIIVENMHEPLVDRDLFDRVQKLIKLKKRANSNGISNIFAGVLKCVDCGGNMTYKSYNGRSGCIGGNYLCNKYRHMSSTDTQRKSCTAHYLPYRNVYAATLARLNAIISANLTEADIVRQLASDQEPLKATQKEFNKLKRRNDELDRIIRKIVEQNALGDITPETFTKLYSCYINEQGDLAEKMKTCESTLFAEANHKENARMFVEQVSKYIVSEDLSREIILDLIDRIEINEPSGNVREGTRQQKIVFHYRFVGQLPDYMCSL